MSGLINDLIDLLNEQVESFSDLAALANEKKEAIVKNDLEHLQKITGLENTLVGKNQKLERKRTSILSDMSMVLNINVNNLTLTELAKKIENQPEHEALAKVISELRGAAEELKIVNEQNRVLIDNSLEYIDFSMNLIRSAVSKQPTFYTSQGEEMQNNDNFFDARQ